MTPKRTAEQIAEEVLEKCWEQTELCKPTSAKKIIAQALTEARKEGFEAGLKSIEDQFDKSTAYTVKKVSPTRYERGFAAGAERMREITTLAVCACCQCKGSIQALPLPESEEV